MADNKKNQKIIDSYDYLANAASTQDSVPVLFPQLRQVKLSWNPMRISITTNRQR